MWPIVLGGSPKFFPRNLAVVVQKCALVGESLPAVKINALTEAKQLINGERRMRYGDC